MGGVFPHLRRVIPFLDETQKKEVRFLSGVFRADAPHVGYLEFDHDCLCASEKGMPFELIPATELLGGVEAAINDTSDPPFLLVHARRPFEVAYYPAKASERDLIRTSLSDVPPLWLALLNLKTPDRGILNTEAPAEPNSASPSESEP